VHDRKISGLVNVDINVAILSKHLKTVVKSAQKER
jgi:hypothetical protein